VFCKPVVDLKDLFEVILQRRRNPDCCGMAFISIAEQGSELCLVDQTKINHLFCLTFGTGQNLGSSEVQVIILTDALSNRIKYAVGNGRGWGNPCGLRGRVPTDWGMGSKSAIHQL